MNKRNIIFGVVVLLLMIGAYAYGRSSANSSVGQGAQTQQQAQSEMQALIAKVSQLILLPTGETPTIATVIDPSKLADQPFFARAKKGDKVLIYTNAREAILYNPDTNKIIAVAPINIGNPPPPASASSSPASSTKK